MNRILQRIHDVGARAWLNFVQALNWLAVSLGGGIVAFDTMYHQQVESAAAQLSPATKLIALAAWALAVHYATRRAKKAA